ncbi:MAG: hypothetical protein ACH346_06445 [Chthoniobacterales bacterium]
MKKPLCSFLFLTYFSIFFAYASAQAQVGTLVNVVTAAQYCDFLNHVATGRDPGHLYNEAMTFDPTTASIARVGEPGRCYYEVIEGKENCPIHYVSELAQASCANRLQVSSPISYLQSSISQSTSNFNSYTEDVSLACNNNFFEIELPSAGLSLLGTLSAPDATLTSLPTLEEVGGVVGLLALVALCPEFITLEDFREAAAHPDNTGAERLVVIRDGENDVIKAQEAGNRSQNLEIINHLTTALESEHSPDAAQNFIRAEISQFNLITEPASRLSHARLQRILAAADAVRDQRVAVSQPSIRHSHSADLAQPFSGASDAQINLLQHQLASANLRIKELKLAAAEQELERRTRAEKDRAALFESRKQQAEAEEEKEKKRHLDYLARQEGESDDRRAVIRMIKVSSSISPSTQKQLLDKYLELVEPNAVTQGVPQLLQKIREDYTRESNFKTSQSKHEQENRTKTLEAEATITNAKENVETAKAAVTAAEQKVQEKLAKNRAAQNMEESKASPNGDGINTKIVTTQKNQREFNKEVKQAIAKISSSMSEDMSKATQRIEDDLVDSVRVILAAINKLDADLSISIEETSRLGNANEDKARIAELQGVIKNAKQEQGKADAAFKEAKKRIDVLEAMLAKAKENAIAAKQEAESTVREVLAKLENFQKNVTDGDQHKLLAELDRHHKAAEEANRKVQVAELAAKQIEEDLQELKERTKNLENKINNQRDTYNQKIHELEEALKEALKKAKQNQEDQEKFDQDVKGAIAEISSSVSEATQRIEDGLVDSVTLILTAIDNLNADLSTSIEKTSGARNANEGEARITQLQGVIENAKQKQGEADAALKEAKKRIDVLEEMLAKANENAEVAKEEVAREINENVLATNEAKRQVQVAESAAKKIKEEAEALKAQSVELQKNINDANEKIKQLEEALSDSKKEAEQQAEPAANEVQNETEEVNAHNVEPEENIDVANRKNKTEEQKKVFWKKRVILASVASVGALIHRVPPEISSPIFSYAQKWVDYFRSTELGQFDRSGLLSTLASPDELKRALGAKFQWPSGWFQMNDPKNHPEREGSRPDTSHAQSIRTTQQLAPEIESPRESSVGSLDEEKLEQEKKAFEQKKAALDSKSKKVDEKEENLKQQKAALDSKSKEVEEKEKILKKNEENMKNAMELWKEARKEGEIAYEAANEAENLTGDWNKAIKAAEGTKTIWSEVIKIYKKSLNEPPSVNIFVDNDWWRLQIEEAGQWEATWAHYLDCYKEKRVCWKKCY